MRWLLALLAAVVGGLSEDDVTIVNRTGVPIARILIDDKVLEGNGTPVSEKVIINVSPEKHDLKIVFRGGGDALWPHFDFKGVHEIIFERIQNQINARVE